MSFSHEEIELIEERLLPLEKMLREIFRKLSMEIEGFEYKYIFDCEKGIIKVKFYKKMREEYED